MKTIEKNLHHKPELDSWVQQNLNEAKKHLALDAENFGIRGKPELLEENIKPYYNENHHFFHGVLNHVAKVLQPAILISEVEESERITARKIQGLNNQFIAEKEKESQCAQSLKGKQAYHSKFKLPIAWLLLSVPLIADAILNRPAFEAFGYSYLESLLISLIVAGGLTVLAHLFERIVNVGKTVWQRRAIAGSLLLIVFVLFYYLSAIRAAILTADAQSSNTSIHFSGLPFALLSLMFFIVALAINRFLFPNAEQRRNMRELQQLQKELAEHIDMRKKIEHEIEALKQAHEELRQTNGSIYVYGCKLEESIIVAAQAGLAQWCKVNMMHRPDNGRPHCFDSHEYPFHFNRHFKPIDLF